MEMTFVEAIERLQRSFDEAFQRDKESVIRKLLEPIADGTTPRPSVFRFALIMESKLRLNEWKGGWEDVPNEILYQRLCGEFKELETALQGCDNVAIMRELVDIANYCMMMVDNMEVGK